MTDQRYQFKTTDSHMIVIDTKTDVEHKFSEQIHYLDYDGPLPSAPDNVASAATDVSGKPVADA